jgi:hypothetical protein
MDDHLPSVTITLSHPASLPDRPRVVNFSPIFYFFSRSHMTVSRRVLVLMVVLLGFASGCATSYTYTMIAPQVSGDNRYVGGEMEVMFGFTPETVKIMIYNSSLNNFTVNWNLCSFVDAEGRTIRLANIGEEPASNIPPGGTVLVEFTLAEWHHAPAKIWNRRESLRKHLVYDHQVNPNQPPLIKFNMPVAIWETDEMNRLIRKDEKLVFQFAIQPKGMAQAGRRG